MVWGNAHKMSLRRSVNGVRKLGTRLKTNHTQRPFPPTSSGFFVFDSHNDPVRIKQKINPWPCLGLG